MVSNFTDTPTKIQVRLARWKLGGYGWFPKTDDEREQVRILIAVTTDAQEEYFDGFRETRPEAEAQAAEAADWLERFPVEEQTNATYGTADLKSDKIRDEWLGEFEGYKVRDILSPNWTINSKRLDIYNRYCATLATRGH